MSVNVIIPTYNRSDVLPRAINSVINQTYDDIRITVVDDGSTDGTKDMMERYISKYSDVNYIRFNNNQGANVARNKGIEQISSQYISFLDSDDEFARDYIQVAIEELENNDSIDGVYSSQKIIEDGDIINTITASDILVTPKDVLIDFPACGSSTLTVDSNVFSEVGYFNESLPAYQEREWLVRYLPCYDLLPIEGTFVKNHIHSGDSTGLEERISDNSIAKLNGLDKITDMHEEYINDDVEAYVAYQKGLIHMEEDGFQRAEAHFRRAINQDISRPKYYMRYIYMKFWKRPYSALNSLI
jgi:glycosyltransferase involved in cell wall biosynthesis